MASRPAKRDILLRAFKARKTNAEALAIYKKAYPHTVYSLATINWYRNKLRAEGEKIPSERDCR